MAYYTIPFNSVPQQFDITIPLRSGNRDFRLQFTYNYEVDYWLLDIMDANTGGHMITGLALTPGNPDYNLLASYAYMDIGEIYVVPSAENIKGRPHESGFAADFLLIWGDNDELSTAI